MQSSEEREILAYLSANPKAFFSPSEICRRAAGKKRYLENPRWAVRLLSRLVERQMLERNASGHYRIISRRR